MIFINVNFLYLVTVFWTFFDNHPAKSDIKGLIETTSCQKSTFRAKIYGLKKSKF